MSVVMAPGTCLIRSSLSANKRADQSEGPELAVTVVVSRVSMSRASPRIKIMRRSRECIGGL